MEENRTITKDWPNNTGLAQLESRLEYVLLDDNYKTLHKPFCCKDYFNEIFATEVDGKSRIQYGFISKKFPIDIMKQKIFKLGLLNRTKDELFTKEYLNQLVKILNKIETNRGYILSTIEITDDINDVVLISDTKWMETPVYFSLYTLLIRLAYNYISDSTIEDFISNELPKSTITKIASGDGMQANSALDLIKYLSDGGLIGQTWDEVRIKNNPTLHNSSGIVSYFSSKSKSIDQVKKHAEDSNKNNNKISSSDSIKTPITQSIAIAAQEATSTSI